MKKILFAFLPFMLLGACGSQKTSPEDEVRNYGKYFTEKMAANQLDSLTNSYPDIAKADSIMPIRSDTIIVVESAPGQYDLTLAEGITLKVNRTYDGIISVTESKGLFAFPADKVEIAKKTGMWDDNLSDAQLNERMKDESFGDYLKKVKTIKTSNIISIGKLKEPEEIYGIMDTTQPLTNLTDIPIDAKDYSVVVEYQWQYPATEWDDGFTSGKFIDKGKNIPAKGTVNYPMETGFRGYSQIVGIKWNLSPKELQEKFAPYTGKEYQEYLDSKK